MAARSVLRSLLALLILGARAPAQVVPPGDAAPVLRLEAGGPTAYVTALAFSPDGKRLYAAGLDKVVRVWSLDGKGNFRLDRTTYRVPLGPGVHGYINALAVSPDGSRLAVGGQGVYRGLAGFRQIGYGWPVVGTLDRQKRQDVGMVYVFNTNDNSVRLLRGHTGPVFALAFAPSHARKPALLVSAALDWNEKKENIEGGLRLWDAEEGTPLAEQGGQALDSRKVVRPDLAVWHSGDGARAVRAAFSWGDGQLGVWEVERDRVQATRDGRDYLRAAYLPGRNRLLTAGSGAGSAHPQLWRVETGERLQIDEGGEPQGKLDNLPWALVPLASRADGRSDYAAVVARLPSKKEEYRLQIFDVREGTFGALKLDERLWQGPPRQPALAAAPRGGHLAVAGGPDHAILVYSIKDLLAKRVSPQRLRSEGETFRNVAFAVKGKQRGLVLGTEAKTTPGAAPPAPGDGTLIFDFDARRPTADRDGWKTDAPDLGDWRVKWSGAGGNGAGRETLTLSEDGKEVCIVRLYPDYTLSDFALIPSATVGRRRIPLLAVASQRRGQPLLALYNARTGEQLRDCSGHTDGISAVAFSADGRLLASVAEDQTVSIWELSSLDRVLDRHGLLHGVRVRDGGGSVVVGRVDDDSPLRDRLKEGDVIEAVVVDDKPKELTRPDALYEAVDRKEPGQTITLRLRRRGDVAVKVGQGFDTRNPLLSLFVTRKTDRDERQWIGWSPLGPYDVSGQRAEALLGWHLNTGRAEAPAQFAPAGEYRRQFYRAGLLKGLIARGELPPQERLPPPEMGLLIDDGKLPVPDESGVIPVRSDRVMLRLKIDGRPPETLSSVTWSLDGGDAQKFEQIEAGGRQLSAPLEMKRGIHRVRVVARAKDDAEEYAAEVRVRYQPPAPVLKLKSPKPGKRVVVREPGFMFRADVQPGKPGEKVLVTLRHTYQGREVLKTEPRAADEELSQKVQLQPGDNTIEITAQNRDALAWHEGEETVRQSVVVNYRKKDEAPLVTLKRLVLLTGERGEARDLGGPGAGLLVVTVPRVRVEGEITATAPLTRAEWFLDQGETGKALTGFASGKRSFTVAEKIELRPGEQTLRFVARTEDSDPAERSLRIEYRPQVPRIADLSPEGPVKLVAGKDPREIKITGQLAAADNKYPFRAIVVVNGKESSAKIEIADGAFSATVPVGDGLNRVAVELNNRWGSVSRREVEVRYVRPPRITRWRGPAKAMTPGVELVAEVDSVLPLRRDSVRAEVNGNSIVNYEVLRPDQDSPRTWRVRLKNVLLGRKGENVVTLSVANEEDRSEPSSWRVEYDPPSPPEVSIIEPGRDGATQMAEVSVRIRIKSATPLQEVTLVREGGEKWSRSLGPKRFTKDGDHYLSAAVQVPLEEGANVIRAEAANKGGAHQDTRKVSYLPPPVLLEIIELVPRGEKGRTPARRGGELVFKEPVPGRVKLRGRVVWARADDERLAKPATVRVFVNGFQQVPADLGPAERGSRVRTFERDILLNRDKGNRIEVALADLPGLSGVPTRCTVDCSEPVRGQRLHLLIVSAQEVDPAKLEKEFLEAFRARAGTPGVLQAPSFDRVIVYGPLVGDNAHYAYVNDQLVRIHQEIKGNARSPGAGNDVVVFYFKGGEAFTAEGNHLFVATGRRARAKVVDFKRLVDLFADTPGAHVLFFDVDREPKMGADTRRDNKDQVERWEDFHRDVRNHVAVLRYAWLGGPRSERDPMLLRALQAALPQASLLLDVTNQLRTSAASGADKLLYHPRVPEELQNLRVGARP